MRITTSSPEFTVKVVQYLRPDGRKVEMETDIDVAHRAAYERMRARGWNLAAEVLGMGVISITVEDRLRGVDICIKLARNGPEVPKAIGEVLEEACPEI